MRKPICPMDELVEVDLPGFLAVGEEHYEEENFDLSGKERV